MNKCEKILKKIIISIFRLQKIQKMPVFIGEF